LVDVVAFLEWKLGRSAQMEPKRLERCIEDGYEARRGAWCGTFDRMLKRSTFDDNQLFANECRYVSERFTVGSASPG